MHKFCRRSEEIGLEARQFHLPDSDNTDIATREIEPTPPPTKPLEPEMDWASQGDWIQIFSRASREQAISLAEDYRKRFDKISVFRNISVFRYDNGWYVLVLGPYEPSRAKKLRDRLVAQRLIPNDSFVVQGNLFVEIVWNSDTTAGQSDSGTADGEVGEMIASFVTNLKAQLPMGSRPRNHHGQRRF